MSRTFKRTKTKNAVRKLFHAKTMQSQVVAKHEQEAYKS